jgi:hypothetical protein
VRIYEFDEEGSKGIRKQCRPSWLTTVKFEHNIPRCRLIGVAHAMGFTRWIEDHAVGPNSFTEHLAHKFRAGIISAASASRLLR